MKNFYKKISLNPKMFELGIIITPETMFLKGYCDFGASIFDVGLQDVKKDIEFFASKDEDKTSLSEEEAIDFYNHAMKKFNKNFVPIENFKGSKNPVMDFIKKYSEEYNNSLDIQKSLQEKTNRFFNLEEAQSFVSLNKKQLDYVKQLIIADKENKASVCTYCSIAKNMKKNDIEKFEKLLKMDFISEFDYSSLMLLNSKEFQQLEKFSKTGIDSFRFPSGTFEMLVKLPEEEINELIEKYPKFDAKVLNDELLILTKNPFASPVESFVFDVKTKECIEKIVTDKREDEKYTTIENYRNNITHSIHENKNEYGDFFITKQIIARYDDRKNLISKEIFSHSKDFNKNVNVSTIDNNGIQKPIQWLSIEDSTGNKIIQRDLESPAGTKTSYYYEETPQGIQISEYKIVDKNGKVLLDERRTFQSVKNCSNKFVSSVNEKVYIIEHKENEILVTDKQTKEEVIINIDNIVTDNKTELRKLLKKLSGEKLIALKDAELNKLIFEEIDNGSFNPISRVIDIPALENSYSEEEQLRIFLHEFGHFLDTSPAELKEGEISNSKEFHKVYEKELANLKKYANSVELQYINYFVSRGGGTSETVAEGKMALSHAYTTLRTYFLQKYFPETIAVIAKK